jgi:hypothetical protein
MTKGDHPLRGSPCGVRWCLTNRCFPGSCAGDNEKAYPGAEAPYFPVAGEAQGEPKRPKAKALGYLRSKDRFVKRYLDPGVGERRDLRGLRGVGGEVDGLGESVCQNRNGSTSWPARVGGMGWSMP